MGSFFNTIAGNVSTLSGDFVTISGSIIASVSGNTIVTAGDLKVPFDQDDVTNSITDVSHPHDDIHDGIANFVTDFQIGLASGTFTRYLVQTSSKIVHMLFNVVATPGVITRIWENPTVSSAGIALTTINRSRVSGIASVTTVYISGVISSGTGTLLEAQVLGLPLVVTGPTVVQGVGGTSNTDRNENEYNLKTSGSYILEAITLGSGTNINNQMRWYEM